MAHPVPEALLIIGILLFAAALLLRASAANRHVRGRLLVVAAGFLIYALARGAQVYSRLPAELDEPLRLYAPLVLAFAAVMAIVTLAVNPWRTDRLPDRFPTILQDTLIAGLFAIAATAILREKVMTTTAVGAVVIGFALQDTLGNLFAGLAIQVEKPFRVGHWVSIGEKEGLVSEITWRATKMRTKAGNLVVVPNSVLARDTITNYSQPAVESRMQVEVGVSYDAAPNEVKAAILEAIRDEPLVSQTPAPEVLLVDFAAYAVVYRVRFWIADFAADERAKDRVRSAIYYAFRRRAISIPYPIQVQYERALPDESAVDRGSIESAIASAAIFAPLTPDERRELAASAQMAIYAQNEVVVRQGDAGSSMFIIARGTAVVSLDAGRREVARLGPGDFFGEMSLLTGEPRTATVTAACDCALVEIPFEGFRRFVMTMPSVLDGIAARVADRAAALQRHRDALTMTESAGAALSRPLLDRIRRFFHLSVTALVLTTAAAASARAQMAAPPRDVDAEGRRRISATSATSAITLDGTLDEQVWQEAEPAGDFIQSEPHEGEPATEATEVRVVFDREALYIGVVCHDRTAGGLIVNDIRKDFVPGEQDSFEVILDTFADRRNGFVFVTNPAGAKSDTQIANEGRDVNTSWDAVWTVAARRGDDGWSAEMRIPFKTLRFTPGQGHIWGINFSRRIRRNNEIDYWSPIPRVYNLYRAGLGGTLTGLPDASQGRNLRIKPWLSADTTRGVGGSSFAEGQHAGLDVKYGVTPSLTLDLTVKPDFAQAEADEQQVNLTQFSLFYPEKREFFLENSGTFYFGDIPRESRLGTNRFSAPEEEVLLFFSRRIGLTDDGQPIPILGGARLTGRAGRYGIGLMTIQTEDTAAGPGDNYTVVRGRREFLGNSDVGAIFLSRQSSGPGDDYNRVVGVDANFRFFRALSINSFLTRSQSPGVSGGEMAGKGSISWNANLLHTQYSLMSIGDNFRDDVGYIRRTGIRKHFIDFGMRPRPEALHKLKIREIHPHTRYNIYTDQKNVKVSHTDHVALTATFESGASIEVALNPRFERIATPFAVRPDQSFVPGAYGWNEYELLLESDHSRRVSGSVDFTTGGFWTGTQQTTKLGVLIHPSYHLTLDTALQRNDISLPAPMHAFVVNLVTSRIGYAFNTRMFLDTLLQYNTDLHQFSANVRFDLIHRPLSDLFVVYNEQQLTNAPTPVTPGRGLIVKYTHMLAF